MDQHKTYERVVRASLEFLAIEEQRPDFYPDEAYWRHGIDRTGLEYAVDEWSATFSTDKAQIFVECFGHGWSSLGEEELVGRDLLEDPYEWECEPADPARQWDLSGEWFPEERLREFISQHIPPRVFATVVAVAGVAAGRRAAMADPQPELGLGEATLRSIGQEVAEAMVVGGRLAEGLLPDD